MEEDNKKLLAQLAQSQKMEAIGNLAGGIAHDFNNMLGVIMGYTKLTLDNLSDTQKATDNLQRVISASERVKQMINQILSFSRKVDNKMMPINIGDIIKETISFLRSSIPSTIDIKNNIENDLGAVIGDATQISQILMNLSTNAAYAMKNTGGVLEINLKKIKLDKNSSQIISLKHGVYQLLTVSDTDSGISKKIMDRIFEPFFTTKDANEGTGMGLAVIYGIVKAHKGEIKVYSEEEKGTVFNIYFPVSKIDKAKNLNEVIDNIPRGKNERILLVDDEETLSDLFTELLKQLGYKVENKTCSLETLDAYRLEPDKYDLVLTDMTMPKLTGLKLAEEIHKIKPDQPVIIITGFNNTDINNYEEHGINGLIMKPVEINELAKVVRAVLDKKSN